MPAKKAKKQARRFRFLKGIEEARTKVKDYFKLRNFDGIKLRGAYFTHYEGREYYIRTHAALALLKKKAPREYETVKRYIKKIVFEASPPYGYLLETRTFKPHHNHIFSNLLLEMRKRLGTITEKEKRHLEIIYLASILYHEAFHGLQYSRIKERRKERARRYREKADKYEGMATTAEIQLLKKLGAPDEVVKGVLEWSKKKPWRSWEPGQATARIEAPRWKSKQEWGMWKLTEAERKAKKKD